MEILTCPVCRARLEADGGSYRCKRGHSFDCAASGYLHLLPASQMHSKVPGDNKPMVAARRRFLTLGKYQPISDGINRAVADFLRKKAPKKPEGGYNILDVGCGEGYYTNRLAGHLAAEGIQAQVWGMDISKYAVQAAAKTAQTQETGVRYGVASLFDLPVKDHSCQVVLDLFAPVCTEEFHRVLKRGGLLVFAVSSTRHLWELKERIYDTPYENEKVDHEYEGFRFLGKEKVSYEMELGCQQEIDDLFTMTPYCYKSSVKTVERLHSLGSLRTQVDVDLIFYQAI